MRQELSLLSQLKLYIWPPKNKNCSLEGVELLAGQGSRHCAFVPRECAVETLVSNDFAFARRLEVGARNIVPISFL